MLQYELSFVTPGLGDPSDPRTDWLIDTYDAIVGTHDDLTVASLGCPGTTAVDAATRAVADMRAHGIEVERLHEDLVTRTDIARRAGVTPQNVGQWIRGERQAGFPAPFHAVGGGVWLWHDVNEWLARVGRSDGLHHPDRRDIAAINSALHTLHPVAPA